MNSEVAQVTDTSLRERSGPDERLGVDVGVVPCVDDDDVVLTGEEHLQRYVD